MAEAFFCTKAASFLAFLTSAFLTATFFYASTLALWIWATLTLAALASEILGTTFLATAAGFLGFEPIFYLSFNIVY